MKTFKIERGTITRCKESAYYVVYADLKKRTVFAEEYVDCNSFSQFDNPNIIYITKGAGVRGYSPNGLQLDEINRKVLLKLADFSECQFNKAKEY